MPAKRKKKEESPKPDEHARQQFAWQYFEVVDEKTAIAELAGFLHPSKLQQGGYARKMAIESVRSAIKRARKNRLIRERVSNNPNSFLVRDFLSWACNHWASLQTVIPTHGATVQLFAPDGIQRTGYSATTFELTLPEDYDALASEYQKLHQAWRDESRRRTTVEEELDTYKRINEKHRTGGTKKST